MSTAHTSTLSLALSERLLAGIMILAFGILLVGGAGFAHSDYLHNAAHDVRHGLGFPCH